MPNIKIDRQLIERCKRQEGAAQKELYECCYPAFSKTCLRYTRDYDEMAIVLNDSFLKIFKQINNFQGKGAFVGWMHRIIINTAIDFTRKSKGQPTDEIRKEDIGYEHQMVTDESGVLKVINSLGSPEKEVFNLFAIEGYSHQEIGELLNITVATSKWHLHNARKKLKEKINQMS